MRQVYARMGRTPTLATAAFLAALGLLAVVPAVCLAVYTGPASPVDVLGQPDFASGAPNSGVPGAEFWTPSDVDTGAGRLVISDTNHRRVLVWNTPPANGSVPADFCLGQVDFGGWVHNPGGMSASGMYTPSGICSTDEVLAVADSSNHRVMVWTAFPTQFFQPCDRVLGAPSPTVAGANYGGLSASSLYAPSGVWTDGSSVVVADSLNNRVLIWSRFPETDGAPADLVLGQPDFTSAVENHGGLSASSLFMPSDLWSDGVSLAVCDFRNHRVLVWDSFPTVNQQPADRVLGQPDFVSNAANRDAATATADGLFYPRRVDVVDGSLFVTDGMNNRAVVWDGYPPAGGAAADRVLGQPDFASNTKGIGPNGLWYPSGVARDGNWLYLVDAANNRVLMYEQPPVVIGVEAARIKVYPRRIRYGSTHGLYKVRLYSDRADDVVLSSLRSFGAYAWKVKRKGDRIDAWFRRAGIDWTAADGDVLPVDIEGELTDGILVRGVAEVRVVRHCQHGREWFHCHRRHHDDRDDDRDHDHGKKDKR